MREGHLKLFRVIVSLVFLIATALLFVDFRGLIPPSWTSYILYLQFVPSLLKFITVFSVASIGFIVIIVVTLLFGRVYCSTVCPLGIFQDVVSNISQRFKNKRKKKYRFSKPHNILRYSILAISIVFVLFGGIFLVYLLDPYSNFGRIFSDLFRPVVISINNGLVKVFESFDIYALYPVDYHFFDIRTAWFPLAILGLVTGFSIFRGRLYCNTICPVGTLLGLLSKASLYKIRIDSALCTRCGQCAVVCKSECINVKEMSVDHSRCVDCFNCVQVCEFDSIHYLPQKSNYVATSSGTDSTKRDFITKSIVYGIGLLGISKYVRAEEPYEKSREDLVPINKNHPVSPPGSISIKHFKDKCTACHLCVSACPTNVLQPSFLEYGFTGMMQPHMDFHTNYCNYDCTICSEVCPTGAILPLTMEGKKKTQIGRVHFIIENCVVYTDNTACGSCSEHCPTQAVRMIPYKDDLTIPETHPDICVGCGACEYACPVRPVRAIYVDGNFSHQIAQEPEFDELEKDLPEEEFPF